METYLVPMWVVECGVQGDGCISMVKAADAQATVEALQARVKECDAVIEKQVAILEEINKLDAERAAFVVDLKAQLTQRTAELEALQRERDHAKKMAAVQKEVADNQTWHVCELRQQLSQLQALVRALPVPEEGGFPIVEVDGDYYVNHTSRFSTKAEADAYTGLLIYRATLDATTPAVCPDCDGDGAVDSGGTDPNGNPLMRRCGCREKGGDDE